MLTGKAKTDYMREYMRRRRSNAKKQGSNVVRPRASVRPEAGCAPGSHLPKGLTYERDDYSQ